MILILRATQRDFKLLADIGSETFIESHSQSASESDIASYVNEKYGYPLFLEELKDLNNIYHIIYYKGLAVGYSKIILNSLNSNIELKKVSKLERLYVLKAFYNLKLGLELFKFNVELSKSNQQTGMWLYVWQGNERAVDFYKKCGFEIIGSYDFRISATHSNPNHQLLLKY